MSDDIRSAQQDAVPADERRCHIGGLMRCCTETIRTTRTASVVGTQLNCRWCSTPMVVGLDGAWSWDQVTDTR